jgi:hypothetical protein
MEDLYMWKDTLMVLFNLIDYNHSGTVKLFSCEPSGTGKKKRLVY